MNRINPWPRKSVIKGCAITDFGLQVVEDEAPSRVVRRILIERGDMYAEAYIDPSLIKLADDEDEFIKQEIEAFIEAIDVEEDRKVFWKRRN